MSCHTDECWVTASECHIHPNLINPPAWPSHSVTSDLIANKWNQCDTHSPREVLFWAPVYVCHFSCLLMMSQLWGEVVARMNCLNVGNLPTYCLSCYLLFIFSPCHLATNSSLPSCHLGTLPPWQPYHLLSSFSLIGGSSMLRHGVQCVSLQLPSYDESTLRRGGGKNELFKCWHLTTDFFLGILPPCHLLSSLPSCHLLSYLPPCHLAILPPWQPCHLLSSFSLIGGSSVLRHDKGPRWWWERFIISIIIEVNWGLTQSKVD